jgi:hypothetical protein
LTNWYYYVKFPTCLWWLDIGHLHRYVHIYLGIYINSSHNWGELSLQAWESCIPPRPPFRNMAFLYIGHMCSRHSSSPTRIRYKYCRTKPSTSKLKSISIQIYDELLLRLSSSKFENILSTCISALELYRQSRFEMETERDWWSKEKNWWFFIVSEWWKGIPMLTFLSRYEIQSEDFFYSANEL